MITVESLDALFVSAADILQNCGPGAPDSLAQPLRDYAIYNLDSGLIDAVGFSWVDPLTGLTRSAKIKNNSVTDHYIIYGRDQAYFSAQIDPVSKQILCKYKIEPNGYEPKVDIKTGKILQDNFNITSWTLLPEEHKAKLVADQFPFLEQIYCWAPKPYGTCVEFGVSQLFGNV